jgi:hypothetical protein
MQKETDRNSILNEDYLDNAKSKKSKKVGKDETLDI